MAQSKAFVDASHALNVLSHALALLESENSSLRGAVDGFTNENAKLREQIHWLEKGDILHVLTDQEYSDQRERERLMQVSIDALDKENAKLREELAKARDPQRIGGQADPESFVYAIEQLREFRWQHATNDEDAIPYINKVAEAHERENAKLRELVSNCHGWLAVNCEKGYVIPRNGLDAIEQSMRELGIEVPDASTT